MDDSKCKVSDEGAVIGHAPVDAGCLIEARFHPEGLIAEVRVRFIKEE